MAHWGLSIDRWLWHGALVSYRLDDANNQRIDMTDRSVEEIVFEG